MVISSNKGGMQGECCKALTKTDAKADKDTKFTVYDLKKAKFEKPKAAAKKEEKKGAAKKAAGKAAKKVADKKDCECSYDSQARKKVFSFRKTILFRSHDSQF